MSRFVRSTLVAGLILAGAASALAVARAQEGPPVASDAEGRVLFAPHLGLGPLPDLASVWCWIGSGTGCDPVAPPVEPPDPLYERAGLELQNLGARETRFLVAYFGDSAGLRGAGTNVAPCDDCRLVGVACSASVDPGATWWAPARFADLAPAAGVTRSLTTSVVAFSLNTLPAALYGGAWASALADRGLGADTTLADLFCPQAGAAVALAWADQVEYWVGRDEGADACSAYGRFHARFTGGGMLEPGLPAGPVRGEPAAGAVAAVMPPRFGGAPGGADLLALDRFAALSLAETGPVEVGGDSYEVLLPGAAAATPDGMDSLAIVQNAGSVCATVQVQAFRTSGGPVGAPVTITVPAGGWGGVDVSGEWPIGATVGLRLTSDQPVAAALSTRGYSTGSTHTASRARLGVVEWASPLAWQERRQRFALDALQAGADGWQTTISALNVADARRVLTARWQATGQPPRPPIGHNVDPLQQLAFQPGFGLGFDGGPGWGRYSSDEGPLYLALESLRGAEDEPGIPVEAWSARAWPLTPGAQAPVAVGLPDLGGPAIGVVTDTLPVTYTAGMTTGLGARVAVQSLYTDTIEVAFDTYAECGYAGTVTRTLDPVQGLLVGAAELPYVRYGANAVVVRPTAGDVAVLAEMARPGRVVASGGLPRDLAGAYSGTPLDGAAPEPVFESAVLTVDRADFALDLDEGDLALAEIPLGAVELGVTGAVERCLSYAAVSDAGWLTVDLPAAPLPGTIELAVAPGMLKAGRVYEGTVTVTAEQPGVTGSPRVIHVEVRVAGGEPRLYLPVAFNRH